MVKHLEEFLLDFNIGKGNVDALAFSETRLSEDIESLYDIHAYNRYSNSRNTMGEGVSIYILDRFTSSLNR